MELRIAAAARDIAGVVHLVTRLEQGDVFADGFDHAGGVIAQHFRLCFDLRFGRADLGVHGIDRDRFDTHQYVVAAGGWHGQFDIEQ